MRIYFGSEKKQSRNRKIKSKYRQTDRIFREELT